MAVPSGEGLASSETGFAQVNLTDSGSPRLMQHRTNCISSQWGAHLCWKCDCVFSFLLLTSWFKTQFQVWEERGTYPKVPLSMQEQIKLAQF